MQCNRNAIPRCSDSYQIVDIFVSLQRMRDHVRVMRATRALHTCERPGHTPACRSGHGVRWLATPEPGIRFPRELTNPQEHTRP